MYMHTMCTSKELSNFLQVIDCSLFLLWMQCISKRQKTKKMMTMVKKKHHRSGSEWVSKRESEFERLNKKLIATRRLKVQFEYKGLSTCTVYACMYFMCFWEQNENLHKTLKYIYIMYLAVTLLAQSLYT